MRYKSFFFTCLSISILVYACSKDDAPEPEPEPPVVVSDYFEVKMDGLDPNATWYAIEGNDTINKKADAQGDALLRMKKELVSAAKTTTLEEKGASTGKDPSFDKVYSINANDEIVHSFTDVSVINTPTITVEEYSHVVNVDTNIGGAIFTFWDEGKNIHIGETDNQGYGTFIFYDKENERTLDSITANPNYLDFEKWKVKDQVIGATRSYIIRFEQSLGEGIAFAVTPTINNGINSVTNTIITAKNLSSPENIYSKTVPGDIQVFENVFVEGESDEYEITIESNAINKPFFITKDTITVSSTNEINHLIPVDQVQNNQDITMNINEFENVNQPISNYQVELRNANTDAVIASGITDVSGQVHFEDVPGETDIYVVGSKSGYYTKTNGIHNIPFVQFTHQADIDLNALGNQKITYADGKPVEAEIINWYLPREDYTPMALDELIVYFPEAGGQDAAIENLTRAAELIGLSNFQVIDEFENYQGYPTGDMISQYNPFPGGETFPGQITTNVTGFFGTATQNQGKILPNGRRINFYTTTFNLGGDESRDHHEFTNLNWPAIDGNITLSNGEFFITTRDIVSSQNVSIDESKWDSRLLPYTRKMQENHYTKTDDKGSLIEYSMPTKFEE